MDRRKFLEASLMASGAALATSALSYGRIVGANDRLRLGHIGIGSRGGDLTEITVKLKGSHNTEMAAVCDLWTVNREKAVAAYAKPFGRAPQAFRNVDEILAQKDIDAVLISTPDHSHSALLRMAVEAGKDVYVEKPMGNVLAEAKAARDAVIENKRIVQVGTQHRSETYPGLARNLIQSGALGDISKIEIVWNYHGPRWRGREEVSQIREQDTDWRRWLLTKPDRPFDPRLYFEFRLYREFSSGIPDQWMSHGIDLVHYFLDQQFPVSVVAMGGVFAWKDGRENADTFQALLEYPAGLIVSYSTSFGNDSDSFTRIMGKKATLLNIGGEGSQRWKLIEEKGTHEANPFIHRSQRLVTLPADKRLLPLPHRLFAEAVEKTYGPLPFSSDANPSHMKNWFECLRSGKQPNATVEHGFAHSVAVIMAARAEREGKKLYWDSAKEQVVECQPV